MHVYLQHPLLSLEIWFNLNSMAARKVHVIGDNSRHFDFDRLQLPLRETSLLRTCTATCTCSTSGYARKTRKVLLTYLSYSAEDGGFPTTHQVQLLAKTFSQARSWLTIPTISISYSPKFITYITQVLTSLPDV